MAPGLERIMTDDAHKNPQRPAEKRPDVQSPPRVAYWHLWRDAEGISRFTPCALERFAFAGVGLAAPQWNNPQPAFSTEVVFTVQPVGWVGDWHENPAPQWIVVLSGRWWVESMDGARIEQGPGEFSFGEDQGCVADASGRKGHRSGTLGEEPAVLMTVRLSTPAGGVPCRFT